MMGDREADRLDVPATSDNSEPASDGEYLSDEGLPSLDTRILRILHRTLRDLGSLGDEHLGENLRTKISKQRESLGRVLDKWRRPPVPDSSPRRARQHLQRALTELKATARLPHTPRVLASGIELAAKASGRVRQFGERRVRRLVTGDNARRVRDYLATQRKKPTIVRAMDKVRSTQP